MSELGDRIKDVIENEPVALFMKGTPQLVMCGELRSSAARAARGGCAGDDGRHPPRPRDPAGAVRRLRLADDPAGVREGRVARRGRHHAGARRVGRARADLEEKLGAGYRDGAGEHVVDVLSGARA